jgi:hypothetical protein
MAAALAPNGLRMLKRLGVGEGIGRVTARHGSAQLLLSGGLPARHQPHHQLTEQRGLDPGQPAASIPSAFREPRILVGSGGGLPRLRPRRAGRSFATC